MVKSYDRFEQEKCFGVIASHANIAWIPRLDDQSSKSSGRVISSGVDEILIWDVKSGELLETLRDAAPLGSSDSSTIQAPAQVSTLVYHESGIIAAGYTDGSIKIWDLASASVLVSFQGHKSSISIIKFDKTGTRIVSASTDTTLILWDLVGETGLFKLKGHRGEITGVEFLSIEKGGDIVDDLDDYLMSTSKDGIIKLWELKTQQCIETHLAHANECWSLGINQDNSTFLTSSNRNEMKLWSLDLKREDTKKMIEIGTFEKESKARCNEIYFRRISSQGELYDVVLIKNADRLIEVFRFRSEDEIKKGIANRTKRLRAKGFSDEEVMESIQASEISIKMTKLYSIRSDSKIRSSCWVMPQIQNKNLDLLISSVNNSISYYRLNIDDGIKKIKPSEAHPDRLYSMELRGHRSDIRAIDISPDNKLLATASSGELKVWNIRNENVIRSFILESGYALSCKFLPGGTLVVVSFKNGNLELYDLATSSLVDRVEGAHKFSSSENSECAIWSLELTPDGKTLISGGNDKSVKFWNFKAEKEYVPGTDNYVTSLKIVHVQTLEVTDDVLCVKVSPDGKFLAVSLLNTNVQVVFLDSLKLYLTLYGHKLPVLSIDISSDSKLIITSSADKNIKIWGSDFGDCHKSIFGHNDSVMMVRFIANTHNFFSAGKDGMIKYWDGDKFECIQKIPAHQSEVWCICTSSDGMSVVSTSHDHSIKVFSVTDDQVFLEEEKEKEMDERYESTLLESLEADEDVSPEKERDDDEGEGEAERISKQSVLSLKAGEKIIEALDIGFKDLEEQELYTAEMKDFEANKRSSRPTPPTPHTVLLALNISGQEYVLDTICKIKPSQMEDALLILSFSYIIKMLRFIQIWTSQENVNKNIVHISTICRILFFILRSNSKELIHRKDPTLKNQLISLKSQLREALSSASEKLGVNSSGLRFLKSQWKATHEFEFIDEEEQKKNQEKIAVKRSYVTI